MGEAIKSGNETLWESCLEDRQKVHVLFLHRHFGADHLRADCLRDGATLADAVGETDFAGGESHFANAEAAHDF